LSEEQSKPPQLYHNNRFMAATVSAGLAGKSINDGIEAMERIKTKILDDTFN
jgi:HAE1 family hydrophobic/amphiphilic exporter-1/multidrug efflux pump